MGASVQQKARLAAGASSGTAGVAAFDQAQTEVNANRDAAISTLKGTAAQVGAPGALTTQLATQLSAPASVAYNNLAQLGAVAGSAAASEESATSNYMNEANASLPLIRAEADRDLGQRIGLLNASRSGGGGGGGGGSLSDSELRTRLMGLAVAQRMGLLQNLEKSLQVGQSHAQEVRVDRQHEASGPGQKITGRGSFYDPGNYVPSPSRPDAYTKALQALQGQKITLSQQRNAAYGPGIGAEAAQLGLQVGLDPGTAYGLFGPETDAAYVAANKKLGLYKDPSEGPPVTGQTLGLEEAAQVVGLTPDQAQAASTKTHFVWSDPNSPASKLLTQYLTSGGEPVGSVYTAADGNTYDISKPEDRQRAQQFVMDLPDAQKAATGVVSDVLQDAKRAVDQGLDYESWQRDLMQVPEYRYDPKSFQLAFAQAQPLFAYTAALHTRQTQIPDTGPGVDPALQQQGY